jgi:hypothetical protein
MECVEKGCDETTQQHLQKPQQQYYFFHPFVLVKTYFHRSYLFQKDLIQEKNGFYGFCWDMNNNCG